MKYALALVAPLAGGLLVWATPPVYVQHQQPAYVYDKSYIFAIPVAPDYYYSVGDDDLLAEKIAKIVLERMPKPSPEGPAGGIDRDTFRVFGAGGGQSVDSRVLHLFDTTCVKCHKPGADRPGVQLLTRDRKLFAEADARKEARRRRLVYDSVESGEMRKNAPPLPTTDKTVLKQWMEKIQ